MAATVTPETAPLSTDSGREHLMHVCRQHVLVGEGPCSPGCVAFCGVVRGSRVVEAADFTVPAADICIVCDQLSDSALEAREA